RRVIARSDQRGRSIGPRAPDALLRQPLLGRGNAPPTSLPGRRSSLPMRERLLARAKARGLAGSVLAPSPDRRASKPASPPCDTAGVGKRGAVGSDGGGGLSASCPCRGEPPIRGKVRPRLSGVRDRQKRRRDVGFASRAPQQRR